MRGGAVALSCVAAGLAGVLGCFSDRPATGPEPPTSGGSQVGITDFAYVPPSITVATGTVVTWTNNDDVQHTVTANDGKAFDSGAFGRGATFQLTAGAPGTYGYFCRIHPFMKGTLTVTP